MDICLVSVQLGLSLLKLAVRFDTNPPSVQNLDIRDYR